MLQCRSALLQIAAAFTGTYDPCRGVRFEAAPSGGVVAMATDRASAVWSYDPKGRLEQSGGYELVPSDALVKACRGIKSAQRTLLIASPDADQASIVTDYKAHSKSISVPLGPPPAHPFPPLAAVLDQVLRIWGQTPELSATCGRYDLALLQRVLASIDSDEAVVLSAFDGVPLRIQSKDALTVALLMPQDAGVIPPLPDWLAGLPEKQTN
jgi:hypothetical protein